MRSWRAWLFMGALLVDAWSAATAQADDPIHPRVQLRFDRSLGLTSSLEIGKLEGVDDLLLVGEPEAEPTTSAVSFRSAFTEKDSVVLASVEPSWRLFGYESRVSWRLWGGAVSSAFDLLGVAPGDDAVDGLPGPTPRRIKIGLTGIWAPLDAGLRLDSVSSGLESATGPGVKGDREESEAWLALRLGPGRVRAGIGESSDNVLDDARRSRTTRSAGSLTLELTVPGGSLLSVGASEGTWERVPAARFAATPGAGSGDFEQLFATLYHYGGNQWNMSLSVRYTQSMEAPPTLSESATIAQDLSMNFQPTPTVGISPAVGMSQSDSGLGAGSQNVWASLSLWAAPLVGPLDLTLYADASRSRTRDDLYDGRSVYAGGGLTWHLRRRPPTVSLALEAGYYRFLDAASGSGGYEQVVGQLVLKIASF